jgi:GAF domain-containing protein
MITDPEQIANALHELARLDAAELGLEAVLGQILHAAATSCRGTGGAGLLLLDADGQLRPMLAVGRPRRALEGTQVRQGQGPSIDAFLGDQPVTSGDLGSEARWPDFRRPALAVGVRAWLSVPVRQRRGAIGVLDFACTHPRSWQAQDLAASQAFARLLMATLEQAKTRQRVELPALLQFALEHDAKIERACAVIMNRDQVNELAAFGLLRQRAFIEDRPIRAVAEHILAHLPNE